MRGRHTTMVPMVSEIGPDALMACWSALLAAAPPVALTLNV